MSKICDHKSVGMIVQKDGKILLIERAKFPKGFACPAGHVDEDPDFETCAKRELKEEVGLEATDLKLLIEKRKDNPCRREDGTWHYWKVFKTEASGDVVRSLDETKKAGWYSKEEIKVLGEKTEAYLAGNIPEEDWNANPGLEPIWYEWFKELEII